MLMHRTLLARRIADLQYPHRRILEHELVVRRIDFHRVLRESGPRPEDDEREHRKSFPAFHSTPSQMC